MEFKGKDVEKQEIDFKLIRECLVDYARDLGRPEFKVYVVRRVIDAFRTGKKDRIKAVIEKRIRLKDQSSPMNCKRRIVKQFCERPGAMKLISTYSKVSSRTLRDFINGDCDLTDGLWVKVLDSLEDAEAKYQERFLCER